VSSFCLELNALIGCRHHLRQLAASADFIYAPYWAISEELINLNEDSFWTIRRLFRELADSGLFIDWTDNFVIVANAFRVVIACEPFAEIVKDAFFDIVSTERYSMLPADNIKKIKKLMCLRRLFDKNRRDMNVYEDIKMRTQHRLGPKARGLMMLEDAIIRLQHFIKLSREEMIGRYDHTLDRYFLAQGKFMFEKRLVERNDGFDLEYFKYLQNDLTYMVSDDRLMHFLDSKKVYTNAELLMREKLL